jgi:hypothetical protein
MTGILVDVNLIISGYDGSTKVASLLEAFEGVSLDVVLPALKTDLLSSASLTGMIDFFQVYRNTSHPSVVLPTTGRENNISHVAVTLNNPFSAALEITKVSSNVSYEGIPLGHINQAISFDIASNSTTKSPELNLDMNFDPSALFTVTRSLAVQAGLDVIPLDAIVKLGGYSYLQTASTREVATEADLLKRQANLFKYIVSSLSYRMNAERCFQGIRPYYIRADCIQAAQVGCPIDNGPQSWRLRNYH